MDLSLVLYAFWLKKDSDIEILTYVKTDDNSEKYEDDKQIVWDFRKLQCRLKQFTLGSFWLFHF